jgi:COMPASS component SWD3
VRAPRTHAQRFFAMSAQRSNDLTAQTPPPSSQSRVKEEDASPPSRSFPLASRADSFSNIRDEMSPQQRASDGTRLELLEQENASLRRRVRDLEKENERLKSSLFALSDRLSKVSKDRTVSLDKLLLGPTVTLDRSPSVSVEGVDGGGTHGADGTSRRASDVDSGLAEDLFGAGKILQGHEAAVYAVQFSPAGRHIASTSLDRTVRVWTLLGSDASTVVGKHDMAGSDVRWLKDDLVASASLDATVKVWSVPKGECISSFRCDGFALCLCNDAPSQLLYAGTASGTVHAMDSRVSALVGAWKGDAAVNAVLCWPDQHTLMCGDAKGVLTSLDLRTMQVLEQVGVSDTSDSKPISGLAALFSSSLLAVNSYDSVLRVFDTSSRTLAHSLRGHRALWRCGRCTDTCVGARDRQPQLADSFHAHPARRGRARGYRLGLAFRVYLRSSAH